jgi:hypothetical protein
MAQLTPRQQAWARLWVGLGLVLLSVVILVLNLTWIRNTFAGPQTITEEALHTMESPSRLANNWVTYTPPRVRETGVIQETTRRGTVVKTTRFVLLEVKDRYLLTELPEKASATRVSGNLTVWKGGLVYNRLEDIKSRLGPDANRLLPFHLDADYGNVGEMWAMFGILAFFGLMGAWLAVAGYLTLSRI